MISRSGAFFTFNQILITNIAISFQNQARILRVCYHLDEGDNTMIKCRLAAVRGEKRWNQRKLSRVTGIREASISEIERTICKGISFEQMNLICEALNCQPGDMFIYKPDEIPNLKYNMNGEPYGPADNP